MRSDKGVETVVLADCHLALREALAGEELSFDACFWYTTSKGNNTIEQWWAQQSKAALNRWRDWCIQLRNAGSYTHSRLADRLAFFVVYLPIIADAVLQFVQTWNAHSIRKNGADNTAVSGIPEILYNYPELTGHRQHSLAIDPDNATLSEWKAYVGDFDLDSYLPHLTREWCEAKLVSGGYPPRFNGGEHEPVEGKVHVQAYQYLREEITQHLSSGQEPVLTEFEKPSQDDFRPRDRTIEVFRQANENL